MAVLTMTIEPMEIWSQLFDSMLPIGIQKKVRLSAHVNFDCSIHIALIRYLRLFYVYRTIVNRNGNDDRTIGDIGTAL
jgi:hypothetical protein